MILNQTNNLEEDQVARAKECLRNRLIERAKGFRKAYRQYAHLSEDTDITREMVMKDPDTYRLVCLYNNGGVSSVEVYEALTCFDDLTEDFDYSRYNK